MSDHLPGSKADLAEKNKGRGAGAPDGQALPSAAEVERACLSCMMQAADHAMAVVTRLKASDFSVEANGVLYALLCELHTAGKPLDVVSLAQVMFDRGLEESLGGPGYLSEVLTAAPNPAHVRHYAEVVRTKSVQRQLVQAGWALSGGIMTDPERWDGYAAEAVEAIISLTTGVSERAGIEHIRVATNESLDAFQNAYINKGHVPEGYSTGFTHLDRMLWGLRRGDNVIVCGRPSMGKTAFAVNVLLNMATGRGHYQEFYHDKDEFLRKENARQGKLKVVLVCLESPPVKMASRAISQLSGVTMQRMRDGLVDKGTFKDLSATAGILNNAEFYLWDAPGLAIEDLDMELKAFKARHRDLAVVCVDHCGLLRVRGLGEKATDYQRTSHVSNRLMTLWRQLDVIGLPLWQLSREVEKRSDKTPRLSDLRDSGSIEQDATHVIAVHRPNYYDTEEPADKALLVLLKNRDGATDSDGLEVNWDGALTLFTSTSDKLFSNNDDKRQPDF